MSSTIFTGTYAVVTYEELEEAQKAKEDACSKYKHKVKDYLITCLCNAGYENEALLKVKDTNELGILRVEQRSSSLYPYELKFYPIKKDGNVSLKSKSVPKFWTWNYQNIPKLLKEVFELAGDSSGS